MWSIQYNGERLSAPSKQGLVILLTNRGHKTPGMFVEARGRQILPKDFNPKNTKSGMKFNETVNGAKAILKVVSGKNVDQSEMNRRAGICNACPKVAGVTDCKSCGFGGRLTLYINELKKTFGKSFTIPNGLSDKYCSICTCSLAVMLPSAMDSFNESAEKQAARPNHCWVKQTSPNYVNSNHQDA